MGVNVSGNYEVDIAQRIITKTSPTSPSVQICGYSDITNGEVNYVVTNVRRRATHTDQRATFSVTFDIFCTYGPYDCENFCGNYTIEIVGGPDGGTPISYKPDDGTGNRYVYPN